MTLKEYLDIMKDLDGYIAKGGRLLDLEMLNPDWLDQLMVQQRLLEEIGPEMTLRLGRFLNAWEGRGLRRK
jgi:hypothetical protein